MLFAVASTLVNCTSSYDHEEPDPQLVELAKYAKQRIPEKHPKVSPVEGASAVGNSWFRCLWALRSWGREEDLYH